MSIIEKGSDLLPLSKVEELAPKDLKAYNESAAKFAAEFNAAYPEGKHVTVNIARVILATGRVNFIVEKHPDLSSQSFSFPYEIADILADNVGAGTADGLALLTRTSLTPIKLEMTVKAVATGDEYKTKDGKKTYKCPAIVKLDGTREELKLSGDAKQVVAEVSRSAFEKVIMGASASKRGGTVSTVARVAETEDADV